MAGIGKRLPFLLLSAASAVVTMKAQKAGGAVQTFSRYSLLLRLETAVISYVRYLGKALWPSKLAARVCAPGQALSCLASGRGRSPVAARHRFGIPRARQRYLAVGWFWFLGSFVPDDRAGAGGLSSMADRYAYIPFIGLFLMLIWLVADWAQTHQFPHSMACDSRGFLSAGVGDPHLAAGWLLA